MDIRQQQALKRCYTLFFERFDPQPFTLMSLHKRNVLTDDHVQRIQNKSTRRDKVAELFQILPTRGPGAFSSFKEVVAREQEFLAAKLSEEYHRTSRKPSNAEELKGFINKTLVPLVGTVRMIEGQHSFPEILKTLSTYTEKLVQNCQKEIGCVQTQANFSLSRQIKDKIDALEESIRLYRAEPHVANEMEIKDEKITQLEKLNRKIENENKKLKTQIASYQQTVAHKNKLIKKIDNELKELKHKHEKLVKEGNQLKHRISVFNLLLDT